MGVIIVPFNHNEESLDFLSFQSAVGISTPWKPESSRVGGGRVLSRSPIRLGRSQPRPERRSGVYQNHRASRALAVPKHHGDLRDEPSLRIWSANNWYAEDFARSAAGTPQNGSRAVRRHAGHFGGSVRLGVATEAKRRSRSSDEGTDRQGLHDVREMVPMMLKDVTRTSSYGGSKNRATPFRRASIEECEGRRGPRASLGRFFPLNRLTPTVLGVIMSWTDAASRIA